MNAPDKTAALAHYTAQAAQIKHVYTLRPSVAPNAADIFSVSMEGADYVVAIYTDDEDPPGSTFMIDAILIGGKWHSAIDTLRDDFIRALESKLRSHFAREAADYFVEPA